MHARRPLCVQVVSISLLIRHMSHGERRNRSIWQTKLGRKACTMLRNEDYIIVHEDYVNLRYQKQPGKPKRRPKNPPKPSPDAPKTIKKEPRGRLQPLKNDSKTLPRAAWEADTWKKRIFLLRAPIKVGKGYPKGLQRTLPRLLQTRQNALKATPRGDTEMGSRENLIF